MNDVRDTDNDSTEEDGEFGTDLGGNEPGGVDCQKIGDFYQSAGRRAVGRYCRRFLNEHALTAGELLHSPRHQQSLSNIPTFVGILQQAERSRSNKGTLNGLVNDIARITRERVKEYDLPELKPADWCEALAGLQAGKPNELAAFLASSAVTACIFPYRNYAEKAAALTALTETATDEKWIALLEPFMAEIIQSESALPSITGDAPFPRLVHYLVCLIAGDRPLEQQAPEVLRRWEVLLKRWPMPVLREGLVAAFCRQLRRPDRFTIASLGDLNGIEAIQREVLVLADIAARLRGDSRNHDDFLGGHDTENALQRRGALLINDDTLHEMLRGRGLIDKLRTLFSLQKLPLPLPSERAINGYIDQFFTSRDFAGRLLDCWKDQRDKLKGVAEVQQLVQNSIFLERDRERMAGVLDEIQSTFIRTQRLLAPLTGKDDAPPDAVLDIAKLAGENAFCHGKTRTVVARALFLQVHRPRFLRAFLLSKEAARMRATRAQWLRAALSEIDVPFLDIAALRVMVVDDEEGPRHFIESVLRDMGIGVVHQSADGRDALDRFAAEKGAFDLVICDWMMPRLSGLEVLRFVRQLRPDLPFLMVTALATPKAVHMALEHKVSGYIAKPFTPDQLEEKVLLSLIQKTRPT